MADGPSAWKEWEERSAVLLAILGSQRVILDAMSSSAAKDGITLQQFSVLRVIGRKGPVPMNKLSDELRVSPPNITGVVDRLEKKGLVRREEGSTDRRRKEIHLTTKGEDLYQRVRRGYSESLQGSLDTLTPEEQEILATLLRKLAKEIARRERAVEKKEGATEEDPGRDPGTTA